MKAANEGIVEVAPGCGVHHLVLAGLVLLTVDEQLEILDAYIMPMVARSAKGRSLKGPAARSPFLSTSKVVPFTPRGE